MLQRILVSDFHRYIKEGNLEKVAKVISQAEEADVLEYLTLVGTERVPTYQQAVSLLIPGEELLKEAAKLAGIALQRDDAVKQGRSFKKKIHF